jgi:hypothetical protein
MNEVTLKIPQEFLLPVFLSSGFALSSKFTVSTKQREKTETVSHVPSRAFLQTSLYGFEKKLFERQGWQGMDRIEGT